MRHSLKTTPRLSLLLAGAAVFCTLIGILCGWLARGFVMDAGDASARLELHAAAQMHNRAAANAAHEPDRSESAPDEFFSASAASYSNSTNAALPATANDAATDAQAGSGIAADMNIAAANDGTQRGTMISNPGAMAPAVEFLQDGAVLIELPTQTADAANTFGRQVQNSPRLPVALALAMDGAGLSPAMQQEAKAMAEDFARDLYADGAGVDPASAAYAQRWQYAVSRSDQQFKMKYGRVAYIRLNQLVAQEAATGAY